MRGRGYIRVSTDEQAKNGDSIPAQQKLLEAYATIKGYDDFEIYIDDGYSGKNLNRPKVQALLEECRSGKVDAVIVWKLDRLSRSLRDTLTIIEDVFQPHGVAFISATENIDTSTPAGRAMLSILATFAQFEREQDSERVTMVHKQLALDCRYLGGPVPLGFKIVDKHYYIDEKTAPIVRRLFDMYITRAGYTAMLHYLNDECGLRTPTGKRFQKNSLNYILSNEKYVGIYIHNRLAAADGRGHRSSSRKKAEADVIRVPGGIPAIITQEVWEAACRMREENRVYAGRNSSRCVFVLAGLCRCAVCGSTLKVKVGGRDRNGTQQRYYICENRCIPACRKEKIESAVIGALAQLAVDEELLIRACEVANSLAELPEERTAEIDTIRQRMEIIARRRANITDFISASGRSAPESLIRELESIDTEEQQLNAYLDNLRDPRKRYSPEHLIARLNGVKNVQNSTLQNQQLLAQMAIYQVIASQDDYKIILTGDQSVELSQVYLITTAKRIQKHTEIPPQELCVISDISDIF